jgi:Protein of unknown function (DUF3096)
LRGSAAAQRNPARLNAVPYPDQYGETTMVVGIAHLQPVIALIAGILILIVPRLLNYIVAAYLILIGLFGLGVIR